MPDPLDRVLDADLTRDRSQNKAVGKLRAVKAGLDEPTAEAVGERYAEKQAKKDRRWQKSVVPLDENIPAREHLQHLMTVIEIQELLHRLPELERAVFILKNLQMLSLTAIGKALGINPRTARRLLDRAMEKLREIWSDHTDSQ